MQFTIQGPTTIQGTITVAGAKNEALKLLAASLCCDAPVRIERVPAIADVRRMAEILARVGASVTTPRDGVIAVDAASVATGLLPDDLFPKLRAGLVLLGPLLHRMGEVIVPPSGGDAIGRRPINLFMDGFRAFGVTVDARPDATRFSGRPRAARYVFPLVSVTGTEALLLLAVRTPGTSVLENVAMEPEVTALAEFLVSCGASISGIGTPTLTITGVTRLSGGTVTCIPDRIEAATFAALTAACGGALEIRGCAPAHLSVPFALLRAMGVRIEEDEPAGVVRLAADPERLRAVSFRTHEYPGLATDLQPPLTVAMTQARGLALIHETVYEGRLFYVDKLNKMGANIILCDPHRCLVEGPKRLFGTRLDSPDIRAGIALLIAAAAAHGTSVIDNAYHIDRGFERIEDRLREIGVRITREE